MTQAVTVPMAMSGTRLDAALAILFPDHSRNRLKAWLDEGHILVDGAVWAGKQRLEGNETITATLPEATQETDAQPEDIPLEIIFEDEHLIIINKPPGLVVHPGAGNREGTLLNALLHHAPELANVARAGIVHRLDKDTSGCMVVAKHDISHRRLTEAFSERRLTKIYLAVINGVPKENSGRVQNMIGRHPVDRKRMAILYDGAGKEAVTEWTKLGEHQGCALIQNRLLTGRTHQIRVHMKEALGFPILGDPIYGHPSRQKVPTPRLMLHAWKLAFQHPIHDQPMAFEAAIPPEFEPWVKAAGVTSAAAPARDA